MVLCSRATSAIVAGRDRGEGRDRSRPGGGRDRTGRGSRPGVGWSRPASPFHFHFVFDRNTFHSLLVLLVASLQHRLSAPPGLSAHSVSSPTAAFLNRISKPYPSDASSPLCSFFTNLVPRGRVAPTPVLELLLTLHEPTHGRRSRMRAVVHPLRVGARQLQRPCTAA